MIGAPLRLFNSTPPVRDTTPHLTRRQAFEAALKYYRPSPQTIEILHQTPLVLMTAPTATGRNTIINELIKTGYYSFLISDTTRPPRKNDGVWEQNGVEYFFRSENEMLAELQAGNYVEAELIHSQQISGINAREIARAKQNGKIAITDTDIIGALTIAKLKPDVTNIILLPPSFGTWLARIRKRSDFTPAELHRRMRQAIKVLSLALESNHFIFVINDDLSAAVTAVDEVARLGVHHKDTEHKARELAEDLCKKAAVFLEENAR